jgi:hypothetical protein
VVGEQIQRSTGLIIFGVGVTTSEMSEEEVASTGVGGMRMYSGNKKWPKKLELAKHFVAGESVVRVEPFITLVALHLTTAVG